MTRPGFRQDIMLCYPFSENKFNKWGKAIVQPKLNGERCRAVIDENGKVLLYSSEANQILFLPHINNALMRTGLKNIELDGECYVHGMPLEDIHSIVSRKVNAHPYSNIMEYHIFDIVNEWAQEDRLVRLNNLNIKGDVLHTVETKVVFSLNELHHVVDSLQDDGYEGVVLRQFSKPYVRKRATNMMKLKPREQDDYVIVGYEQEYTIHNEPKESLGALWLQGNDDEKFKVGTGPYFTRDHRVRLWEIRESLRGMIATIKYQELTADRKVPRHAILVEISTIHPNLSHPDPAQE